MANKSDRIFNYVAEADKTATKQPSEKDMLRSIKSMEKEFDGDIPFLKTRKGQKWLGYMYDLAMLTGAVSPALTKAMIKHREDAPVEIEGTLTNY